MSLRCDFFSEHRFYSSHLFAASFYLIPICVNVNIACKRMSWYVNGNSSDKNSLSPFLIPQKTVSGLFYRIRIIFDRSHLLVISDCGKGVGFNFRLLNLFYTIRLIITGKQINRNVA